LNNSKCQGNKKKNSQFAGGGGKQRKKQNPPPGWWFAGGKKTKEEKHLNTRGPSGWHGGGPPKRNLQLKKKTQGGRKGERGKILGPTNPNKREDKNPGKKILDWMSGEKAQKLNELSEGGPTGAKRGATKKHKSKTSLGGGLVKEEKRVKGGADG